MVDAVDGDQLPLFEIGNIEFMICRRTDNDRVVIAFGQSGNLQLDVILVRPEPREWIVVDLFSQQGLRDGLGLIDGVLNAFHAHGALVSVRIKTGAISDRVDIRIAGLP